MPSDTPALRRAARPRVAVLALAGLSLISAVAFVLAPVERPDAVYSWPAAAGDASAVAIPLMLEKPAELTASVDCAAVRAAGAGDVLLSTVPLERIPDEPVLDGLRVTATGDAVRFRTGRTDLPEQALPASGDCTWTLVTTPASTTLRLDGRVVAQRDGDVRPVVAGVFSASDDPAGLSVDVTADTVFQTSPSPLKTALGVLAVVSLVAALVLVGRAEPGRRPEQAVTAPPPEGRLRRWAVDAGVVVGLLVWNVIGSLTVDDGYIAGIVHSRASNGYIGNVFRWFNAPEAPFGWFYEVLVAWSGVSSSTVWMRLPSTLLGIATWFLISRGLLPRLGAFARRPGVYALGALAFAVWWLPGDLGLRPEAWVAAGFAAVLVLVERGLARERMLPLLAGVVVAGATLAVTPTGAVAFLPYAAAAVPILRLARRRDGLGLPVLAVAAAAAAASALLLMFADQSLAAVLQATRIRNDLPGALAWSAEPERYYLLLLAGDLQGTIVRRVPVLLTAAAVVGILWQRRSGRWPESAARDVAGRLLVTLGLSLVVLLFTPTKWTLHFGAFVPVGAALIVLGLHLFDRRATWATAQPGRTPLLGRAPTGVLARSGTALTAVLFVAAVAYAGWNQYAYLSNADVPWNDIPPTILGKSFSTWFLAAALLVAGVTTVLVVWARARDAADAPVPLPRLLPSASLAAVVLAVLTVLLPYASLAKSTYERRDTYSLAADALNTVRGRPCGLAEDISVETDPSAGLLPPAPVPGAPVLDGFTEISDGDTAEGPRLAMGGAGLPGWSATGHTGADGGGPARLTTGWYTLPAGFVSGDLPLVVTTTGSRRAESRLAAEFGRVSGDQVAVLRSVGIPRTENEPRAGDARLAPGDVPADADVVRLVAEDGASATAVPMSVSVPRVPVIRPLADVVAPDEPTLIDWPVVFVLPCQTLSVQQDGLTDLPRWRIASTDGAGDISVAESVGGPYTSARALVTQVPVPVYLANRPLERPIALLRWEPRVDMRAPGSSVEHRTVAAWGG